MGKVLVLGGGIAGMQTSLDLADMGHQVLLIEKEKTLGGNLKNLHTIFPSNKKAETLLEAYLRKIEAHSNIKVYTNCTINDLKGKAPSFKATISLDGKKQELGVEALVLATGFKLYDAAGKREYGYGRSKNVMSAVDLEKMLKEGKFERPSDRKKPESIVFVQCVGFRDVKANEYCSSFCCADALKNAILIKKEHPETEVTVMFMDIRTPSLSEQSYSDARDIDVKFVRTRPAEIFERDGSIVINYENTLTGKSDSMKSDLVVLSVGAVPHPETEALSKMAGVPLSKSGFFRVVHEPSGTGVNGVFLVGVSCGPKDIGYSVSQAGAASTQVNRSLRSLNG